MCLSVANSEHAEGKKREATFQWHHVFVILGQGYVEGELPLCLEHFKGRNEVFKGILMTMKGTGLIGQETMVLFLVPEGK